MSFKTNYSDVIICNRALSCLPESPIAMMDAPGIAARECRQHYSPVVRRVLTMHDWGLATKVESLAVSSDNPRREWTYAYAPPADLAFAIDVVPADLVGGNSNTNYFQGMQALLGGTKFGKFKRSDGKIYSNIEDASLVYTTLDITEDAFTEDFVPCPSPSARIWPTLSRKRGTRWSTARSRCTARNRARHTATRSRTQSACAKAR